jgi:hypothetical protein
MEDQVLKIMKTIDEYIKYLRDLNCGYQFGGRIDCGELHIVKIDESCIFGFCDQLTFKARLDFVHEQNFGEFINSLNTLAEKNSFEQFKKAVYDKITEIEKQSLNTVLPKTTKTIKRMKI